MADETSRSRIAPPTTGSGNVAYQSSGGRLEVITVKLRPSRPRPLRVVHCASSGSDRPEFPEAWRSEFPEPAGVPFAVAVMRCRCSGGTMQGIQWADVDRNRLGST